jgi:hypothetical protein
MAEIDTKDAWSLDRFKFLPMLTQAYRMRPNAEWYYFFESDTAVIWSNLFRWLQRLDGSKPYYIGGEWQSGDQEFAHGDSFLLSRPALMKLVERYDNATLKIEMNEETAKGWAGDVVLAKALADAGVKLTRAFPIIQSETPTSLDYTERHWCWPVVSYHHVSPHWVQRLWRFQARWSAEKVSQCPLHDGVALAYTSFQSEQPTLLHRDAFEQFVSRNIESPRKAWNNLAAEEMEGSHPYSPEDCRDECAKIPSCKTWLFAEQKCRWSKDVRLGHRAEGDQVSHVSGWMSDRIDEFKQSQEPCRKDWIT